MGALGVWTPREDHQLEAWDDLSGLLPFVVHVENSIIGEDKDVAKTFVNMKVKYEFVKHKVLIN